MRRSNAKLKPVNVVPMPAPAGGDNVPAPPRKKRRPEDVPYLQEAEIDRLFKVIESKRDRAIFRVAYHAGLRASEIGNLELRDYDGTVGRVYVRRLKGSNGGVHPLCREEQKALRAWLKDRGAVAGPLFPSRNHRPISRKQLDLLMKKYGALAMLPERLRHFHVLKHSCGTHLASKGFNVEQIQDWLGHRNIQNTMIYTRITNKRREEMAEQLRDTWR